MPGNQTRSEDRSRGQRSGEGALTALRALRRDEKRRRNPDAPDSVMPSELPPQQQPPLPRRASR